MVLKIIEKSIHCSKKFEINERKGINYEKIKFQKNTISYNHKLRYYNKKYNKYV